MKELIDKLKKFNEDRDWSKFHTNSNLAKSISIEAAELLELFQWDDSVKKEELESELADVFAYLLMIADKNDIDLKDALAKKIEINKVKYPIDKAKGVSTKYDKLG